MSTWLKKKEEIRKQKERKMRKEKRRTIIKVKPGHKISIK
jgi:hypothetical protein